MAMVSQRLRTLRTACPNCLQDLVIRPEDVGRKGQCKFCGHRFRPLAETFPRRDTDAEGVSGSDPEAGATPMAAGSGRVVAGAAASSWESSSEVLVGPSVESDPLGPGSNRLDRLREERDAARAECSRLRGETDSLREVLARQEAQAEQLQKAALGRLSALRGERDSLVAERALLLRELAQEKTRLLEAQVGLVEVEEELEELRQRGRAQRLAREREGAELRAAAERRHAEQVRLLEAERRSRVEQQKSLDRLNRELKTLERKIRKLQRLLNETRQERDERSAHVQALCAQVETLSERCTRLSTYLHEAEAEQVRTEKNHQDQVQRLETALNEALEEAAAALEREAARDAEVRALRAEAETGRVASRVAAPP